MRPGPPSRVPAGGGGSPWWGRVVEVVEPGLVADDGVVTPGPAERVVDRALTALTGEADPVVAMRRFVGAQDTVGLKVDSLGCPRAVFHPALTARVIQLVKAVGVSASRITVWDQGRAHLRRAGYPVDGQLEGVAVLHGGSPDLPPPAPAERYDAARSVQWSPLLGRCSAVINLHGAKDHRRCGVSGALVNMALGSLVDASPLHPVLHEAVARLYARPRIAGRVRLNLCDAGYVLRQGGPLDQPAHRVVTDTVLASVDPVAMDWAVVELVERARRRAKLPSLYDVERPRRRPPLHVDNAAALGLGADVHEVSWIRATPAGHALPVVPTRLRPLPPTLGVSRRPIDGG